MAQIEELKSKAVGDASEKAFVMMLGLPLIVLRDQFGFGKKRLEKFINYIFDKYECFEEGYVTLDDLAYIIKDETGVKVELKKR